MLQEGRHHSDQLRWLVDYHIRSMYEFLRGQIEKAQAMGLMLQGDATQLLYMLIGAAATLFSLAPEVELLTGRNPRPRRRYGPTWI